MPQLQCTACNYEFDKEKIPNRCPYCGKDGTVVLYKTAQDFLNEAD